MSRNLKLTEKPFCEIGGDEIVKVYITPRCTFVIHCENVDKTKPNVAYRKISKNEYVNIDTGEIIFVKPKLYKTEKSLSAQIKKIPYYVKGFFYGDDTERFITLTYDIPMYMVKRLSKDFRNFLRRVERKYCKMRYFYVKEPHGDGSWHIHCIMKRLDGKRFDITTEDLINLWKLGDDVSVEEIYNIDGLAHYFNVFKYVKKKSRLKCYPVGMRIFAHSSDMKLHKCVSKYNNISDFIQDKELSYQKQVDVDCIGSDNSEKHIGTNKYEHYLIKE